MKSRTLLLAVALAFACSSESTPEAQVRAFLDRAETASAERDLASLRELVSEEYSDARNNTKADIDRLIAAQVLRSRALYLYLHPQELEFPEDGRARVVALAGMARTPIGGLEGLRKISADAYVFELELHKAEDAWRVVSADWRPAQSEDFHL